MSQFNFLRLPKRTNQHLRRYAFLSFLEGEIGRYEAIHWFNSADLDPKKQGRWINRFHRRPGH